MNEPHETSAGETGGQPAMSEEQLAEIREHNGQYGLGDATDIIEELLAEVGRLNAVLDANRVVRNAAESSSRTYKGAMESLKTQRTQLRAELDKCAELNRSLVKDNADATARADAAERELAGMRERMAGLGEARQEWAVHWRTAGGRDHYEACESEEDARESIPDGDENCTVMRRFVGEWKAADGG